MYPGYGPKVKCYDINKTITFIISLYRINSLYFITDNVILILYITILTFQLFKVM